MKPDIFRDCRAFGSKPLAGTTVVRSLEPYRLDPTKDLACPEIPGCPALDGLKEEGPTVERGKRSPQGYMAGGPSPPASSVLLDLEDGEPALNGSDRAVRRISDHILFHFFQDTSGYAASGSLYGGVVVDVAQDKVGGEEKTRKAKVEESSLDWWSKYYASVGDSKRAGKFIEKG